MRGIERGPLAPWMKLYLCWLAQIPTGVLTRPRVGKERIMRGPPTVIERCVQASRFACTRMHGSHIRALELRPDAIEYFAKVQGDHQYRAREIAARAITLNLEAREAGLKKALDLTPDGKPGANLDHKAVEQYTRPYLDYALPKREEKEVTRTRITINLTGGLDAKQIMGKVLEQEEEGLDYEILDNPKLLESGDE